MEEAVSSHPAVIDSLPPFITAPGQTDILFNAVVVFMIVSIAVFGVLYLRLHALPEHLAHGTRKVQLELVSVMALIALLTHSTIIWVAALLLAVIELPDIITPLRSMALSLRRMARGYVVGSTPAARPGSQASRNMADKTDTVIEAKEGETG